MASGFKASALRSVLNDLVNQLRLPEDEKVYQIRAHPRKPLPVDKTRPT
jgi:hypothetical protein